MATVALGKHPSSSNVGKHGIKGKLPEIKQASRGDPICYLQVNLKTNSVALKEETVNSGPAADTWVTKHQLTKNVIPSACQNLKAGIYEQRTNLMSNPAHQQQKETSLDKNTNECNPSHCQVKVSDKGFHICFFLD